MGGLQMYWLRSEDLKEAKVVTTPINKHSSYRRFVLPKSTSKRLDTREIKGIWVEEKQQSNRPRPPSPKSLRKWRARRYGGHGYAIVRVTTDNIEAEVVCIPRPLERSDRPDGGQHLSR